MRSQKKRNAGRNGQVVRLLRILRDLDRLGGVDVYELAERYGTTVRTIWRDLDALEEAGLPLAPEAGSSKRSRFRIAYRDQLRKVSELLDAGHYLALRLAMGQVGGLRSDSAPFAALEDLSGKIETALGAKERARLAAIEGCFHSYEKFAYRRSPPDVLWPLVEAIAQRRLCRVTYRAPRPKPEDRVFNVLPLRLFTHQGAVYLMAISTRFGNHMNLNLHRLQALHVLDRQAEPPRDFDPARLENVAFGVYTGGKPTTYVLRFEPDVAEYIRERLWHPTQELQELPRGAVKLSFTCGESYEVRNWVASWGTNVEVVAPRSLRRELRDYGTWLLKRYAPGGSPPRAPPQAACTIAACSSPIRRATALRLATRPTRARR